MAANQERDYNKAAANLLAGARAGSLATIFAGVPHAALVTPALDGTGQPVLLLSDLSAHTRHLRSDPACALLVVGAAAEENPQTAPRLLLSGHAVLTNDADASSSYLKFHPYAAPYAGFADFNFWRLIVKDAHYVGGFAAAARLNIAALHHEINASHSTPKG